MVSSDPSFCRLHHIGELFRIEFVNGYLVGDDDERQFHDQIEQIMAAAPRAKVIIDMSNVERITSGMLGQMISANTNLSDNNGQLRLADVLPQILNAIQMVQVDQVIDIRSTVVAAVDSFSP